MIFTRNIREIERIQASKHPSYSELRLLSRPKQCQDGEMGPTKSFQARVFSVFISINAEHVLTTSSGLSSMGAT